jgi:acyl-CoA thioesterase FadM
VEKEPLDSPGTQCKSLDKTLETVMILYFRFWFYLLVGYFKPRLKYCEQTTLAMRVLPWDCASKTMNNARFYSFMDIGQHENNIRTGFLAQAVKHHWRVVIRNSRVSFYKPLKMWELFRLQSQVVTWDDRFFYWQNDFLKQDGSLAARGYTAVSVRDRRTRTAVKPVELLALLDPHLTPQRNSAEVQIACSDLTL